MLVPIIGCRKDAAEKYLVQMFGGKITIPPSGKINNYLWKDDTLYKVVEESGATCEIVKSDEKQSADIQCCLAF